MSDHNQNFTQLLADDWDFRMRDNPLYASRTGDQRFNHLMPDSSEAAATQRLETYRGFQTRASEIDRDSLTPENQLNYDIYTRLLADDIRGLEFRSYRFPINRAFSFPL